MTLPRDELEQWARDWRSATSTPDATALRHSFEHETRRQLWITVGLVAATAAAVLAIGFALLHSSARSDAIRAAIALLLMAAAWTVELQRRRTLRRVDDEAPESFIEAARIDANRHLRAIRLLWTIILCELLFLVPWWLEGFQIHRGELFGRTAILGGWLPAALTAAILLWTIWIRRGVHARLARLGRMRGSDDV